MPRDRRVASDTTGPARQQATAGPASAAADPTPGREGIGVPLMLLLVWLWFEFGRPPNPMGIPMVISILLFGGWLVRRDKRWTGQELWLAILLVLLAAAVPMAANTYSAYVTTYGMAATILCICIPLPSIVTSARKVRAWVYTFVMVAGLVGTWALFHGGYGPAGADGAQDENYVAAMMSMAIPFAYFSIFAERRRRVKLLLIVAVVVFTGAIIVSLSRGGFLGLLAVVLYCLARSPRKMVGVTVIVVVVALAAALFAGAGYWQEMGTITDTSEDTADLRLEIWKIGLRMWQDNPVFGVGPGNFRWQVGDYQSLEQLSKYGRNLQGSIVTHSMPVELLAELGTTGAIVVGVLLWRTRRNLRQIQRGVERPRTPKPGDDRWPLYCYADAVLGSILACLVTGVFLSLLYFSYLWLLIALGSAIAQAVRSRDGAKQPVETPV